jgi:xanthine dehydrogenase accessory factor
MGSDSRWSTALEAIEGGDPAVLVAVVEHEGSVPGVAGTAMVVTPDRAVGTVGGGFVEHALIGRARAADGALLVPFVHDGEATDSMCSGRQLTAMLPLAQGDLPALRKLAEIERTGGTGTLVLSPAGIEADAERQRAVAFTHRDAEWRFQMPVGHLDTLTIVGGGHVGLALSRVMATLPFRIVVLDNRHGLPTMADNVWAHERRCIAWERVAEETACGEHAWAVIMTQGHRHDAEVLARLVELDLRYLGLMGSAAKIRSVFAKLEGEGVDRDRLARVRAPIGLPIGSHTPEEIAISIAAELIQLRNA